MVFFMMESLGEMVGDQAAMLGMRMYWYACN